VQLGDYLDYSVFHDFFSFELMEKTRK